MCRFPHHKTVTFSALPIKVTSIQIWYFQYNVYICIVILILKLIVMFLATISSKFDPKDQRAVFVNFNDVSDFLSGNLTQDVVIVFSYCTGYDPTKE
nr:MAG: hypothetical protein [Microvirus sp.]